MAGGAGGADSLQDDLNAWIDGALSPSAAARLGLRLASLPDMATRAVAYRAQIDGLHALYDPVLDEPIPEMLLVRVRDARHRTPLAPAAPVHAGATRRIGLWSAALAASVGTALLGMLVLHRLGTGMAVFGN
ncbi:conserved hypothetical protein [Rhodospirillum centenum SW]|uniref:Anti-sigma factor n=1 Tax=Rhodospirillum centenum (strain ATCC 51521 / SW) TaxID=414684 RepID=B6INE2_RHOCS|nr:conserved hypothetical protein [Rhodospirillum centenum SW]